MAKKSERVVKNGKSHQPKEAARSAALFDRKICSAADIITASWAVCGDLANGRFSGSVGNAIRGNVGNLLKVAELAAKYGRGKELPMIGAENSR